MFQHSLVRIFQRPYPGESRPERWVSVRLHRPRITNWQNDPKVALLALEDHGWIYWGKWEMTGDSSNSPNDPGTIAHMGAPKETTYWVYSQLHQDLAFLEIYDEGGGVKPSDARTKVSEPTCVLYDAFLNSRGAMPFNRDDQQSRGFVKYNTGILNAGNVWWEWLSPYN